MLNTTETSSPVALVTGGARRLGMQTVHTLHQAGFRVIIHCHHSIDDAEKLAANLNRQRQNSASVIQADLLDYNQYPTLKSTVLSRFQRLDLLVNNASSFYPTELLAATETDWQDLFGTNVKAPYFLSQAFMPELNRQQGAIINMVDIHAERPLQHHSIYCMAKAALVMMTKALARELAPAIRVNGIAPGVILWPTQGLSEQDKESVLAQVPLQRSGTPEDIAQTLLFLARAPYITGQIIAVDGGRSLGDADTA